MTSANIRRHYRRHHRRQARSTGRYEEIVGVREFDVKPRVPPGKPRNAGPEGAVGAAEEGETKRRGGVSTVSLRPEVH
jgi:hypothetical protein